MAGELKGTVLDGPTILGLIEAERQQIADDWLEWGQVYEGSMVMDRHQRQSELTRLHEDRTENVNQIQEKLASLALLGRPIEIESGSSRRRVHGPLHRGKFLPSLEDLSGRSGKIEGTEVGPKGIPTLFVALPGGPRRLGRPAIYELYLGSIDSYQAPEFTIETS
jgi:hypothetical protein